MGAKWVALAVLLYVFIRLGRQYDVVDVLSRFTLPVLAGFVGLLGLNRLFLNLRWWMIYRQYTEDRPPGFWFLMRTKLLGEFVGIVMPSVIGEDGIRLTKLKFRGYPLALTATSVLIDRIAGLLGCVVAVLIFLPFVSSAVFEQAGISARQIWISGLAVVAMAVSGGFVLWKRRPQIVEKVFEHLMPISGAKVGWIAISAGVNLIVGVAYYLVWHSVDQIAFDVAMGILLLAQLLRLVPMSVLGIGLGDGSIFGLGAAASSNPDVVLAIVVTGVCARYFFACAGLASELIFDGVEVIAAAMRRKESKDLEAGPA